MLYFLGGLGVTLSLIVLFFNQGNKSINIYLGFFLLAVNMSTITFFVYVFATSKYLIALLVSSPLIITIYLVGPFAYFYVRSILTDNPKLSKWDTLHFAVFLIHLIDILRFYFFSWDIKLEAAYFLINNIWNGLNAVHASKILTIEANFIIAILQLGVYIILIWVLIISKNLHFYIGKVNPQQFRLIKNWLFFFAFIFSYLALIQVVIGLFFIKYKDKMILIEKYKFLFTMLVLGLIILEIGLLLFPKVLYGVPLYKRANLGSQPLIADEVQSEKNFKNTNAILSDEHLEWIVLSLEDWTNSKKYLESDVTMITLAADVNIPIHHLAYYFNQLSEYKFIEWRNNLRIDYVVELIKNKQCQNKTVDTLGKECGFKSNSTFVQNFKLRTGMLPSDLMKKYQ